MLSFGVTKTAILGGDWNTATTWIPLGVPTANDTVVLNTTNALSVTISGSAVCKQLTVTGTSVFGSLTINPGAQLTIGGNAIMSVGNILGYGTINLNGTMIVNGDLNMNYSDATANISGITLLVGNATNAGTLRVNGNINFTGFSNNGSQLRSKITVQQGTLDIMGNVNFSASGTAGASIQAIVQEDNTTFDGKTKVINLYGNILNSQSGAITLNDANNNANCTWRYIGNTQQNLVTTNVVYRHVDIVNSNNAEVWLVNNFPLTSIFGTLTIYGGSCLNTKAFNLDAITRYANEILIKNAGVLRVENKDGVPAQKVGTAYVCSAENSGIIEYFSSTAGTNLIVVDEVFNYPIMRLTGPGVKVMSSKDIDNSATFCHRIEHNEGTFSIASGKKLVLTSVLDRTVYVRSGTIVWINGDFIMQSANWSIHYNTVFHYNQLGTQVIYSFTNSTGAIEPYGSVTLRRASGLTLTNREIPAGVVVKIRGKLEIQGNISLNINQSSILELSSDATYTGWLAEIPSSSSVNYLGTPTGKIVARKYINLPGANYRDFASPIQNTTLNNWQNAGLYMTGFTGSAYPNFGFVSAYQYDESNTGLINDGFVAATNITNTTLTRNGLGKVIRGGWRIYTGESSGQIFTLSDTGQINTGNISFTASFTHAMNNRSTIDGWNFFGNPYPSAVNWNLVYADASNTASFAANGISPTVYCWKPYDAGVPFDEEDSYGFYNAATGVGTRQTNLIPSFGGFWVKTFHSTANSASYDLILKEAHKADQIPTTFAKASNDDVMASVVKIGLLQKGAEDEIWFHPFDGATVGKDHLYDVERFGDIYGTPNINFSENGTSMNLWVNALPADIKEFSVPIQVYLPEAGEFSLKLNNIAGFNRAYGCLRLIDQQTGLIYPINGDTTLSFTTTQEYRGDRFVLTATRNLNSQIDVADATCYEKEDGLFSMNLQGYSTNSNFSLYKDGSLYNSYTGNLDFISEELGRGQYALVNNSGLISCTSNRFDFEIKSFPEVTAAFESPAQWPQNSFVPLQNLSEGAISYVWTFSDANEVRANKTPYYFFQEPGDYKISLIAKNEYGCFSNTTSRDIRILSTTGIEDVSKGNMAVYGTEGGLMIKAENNNAMHVIVYTLDGRKIYESSINGSSLLPIESKNQTLLVRIKSINGEFTNKTVY